MYLYNDMKWLATITASEHNYVIFSVITTKFKMIAEVVKCIR
jgi:hypothetical protein